MTTVSEQTWCLKLQAKDETDILRKFKLMDLKIQREPIDVEHSKWMYK